MAVNISLGRKCAFALGGALLRQPLLLFFLFMSSLTLRADSREALEKAADLVQQGKLEEADQQARLALSDARTRAVACSVMGTIRFRQKRLPESANYFQEAIKLNPRLLGAHLNLAEVYLLQDRQEKALVLYRRVLILDSSNVTARLGLARAETEKGNYQQSLNLAKPVLAAFKQSPDGLLVLAADFAKLHDQSAAAALAENWSRLGGIQPEWSIKFALLLADSGAVSQAVEILEQVKQNNTLSYELAFNLAGVYSLKNDPAQALDYYDEALKLNPQSLPALRHAAHLAEQSNEFERSLSYWIRAKKIKPENPDVLMGFGRLCLKMDLLEDAEPALSKAVNLRPSDPSYKFTLAAAKTGKRQFESAQSLLEEIVKGRESDPQLQYGLGAVLYLQGRLSDAATHLRESIRLQPDQVGSYYYLALIARDQGNDSEAIGVLEKLLQEHPDHSLAREVLGSLLMSAQQYPEAEHNLQEAVRLNPKSVKANYQLGLLLARMGKKEESDKRLEIAKSLRKEDEEASHLQRRLLDPNE